MGPNSKPLNNFMKNSKEDGVVGEARQNAEIKLALNEATSNRDNIQTSQSPRKAGAAASTNVSPKRAITASNMQHADAGKSNGK